MSIIYVTAMTMMRTLPALYRMPRNPCGYRVTLHKLPPSVGYAAIQWALSWSFVAAPLFLRSSYQNPPWQPSSIVIWVCRLNTGFRDMSLQLSYTMLMSISLLRLSRAMDGCGSMMEWQLRVKILRHWSMLDPLTTCPSTCNLVEEELLVWCSTPAFDHLIMSWKFNWDCYWNARLTLLLKLGSLQYYASI
jgi:hypothetical protein